VIYFFITHFISYFVSESPFLPNYLKIYRPLENEFFLKMINFEEEDNKNLISEERDSKMIILENTNNIVIIYYLNFYILIYLI
jgi:hypothetical protein